MRLAGALPALVLAVAALLEPDTDSDAAYRGRGGSDQLGATGAAPSGGATGGATGGGTRSGAATASIWSALTFSWVSPLLKAGSKDPLEHEQLFSLQTEDTTAYQASMLDAGWQREVSSGRNSFFRATHWAFGGYFWCTGLIKLINDVAIFINPFFINVIVSYIDNKPPYAHLSLPRAYLCAVAMLASSSLQSLALGQYFWRGFRLGLRIRVAIGQVVYQKALRLPYEERQRFGIGAIVSHMQIDAAKIGDAMAYLHAIWSAPLQLSIAIAMLYSQLGISSVAGLALMVITMPLQIRIGKLQAKYTKATMATRDRRVSFLSEILQVSLSPARLSPASLSPARLSPARLSPARLDPTSLDPTHCANRSHTLSHPFLYSPCRIVHSDSSPLSLSSLSS